MTRKSNADIYRQLRTEAVLEAIHHHPLSRLADLYFDQKEAENDTLNARMRSEAEVNQILADPASPYHRIVPGYLYSVYAAVVLHTGAGGAQEMYRAFLRQGMTEAMICSVLYVLLDDNKEYPLSLVNVKKNG